VLQRELKARESRVWREVTPTSACGSGKSRLGWSGMPAWPAPVQRFHPELQVGSGTQSPGKDGRRAGGSRRRGSSHGVTDQVGRPTGYHGLWLGGAAGPRPKGRAKAASILKGVRGIHRRRRRTGTWNGGPWQGRTDFWDRNNLVSEPSLHHFFSPPPIRPRWKGRPRHSRI
jgi:hypothetical protein